MRRILIAEDEVRVAFFLEQGLQKNGFITKLATTGPEALTHALEGDFDLLILDLGLPGKEGLSVLEELRGQGCRLPIVILTARDTMSDKLAGFDLGADDYVTKPFRFEELLARIRVRIRTTMPTNPEHEWILSHQGIVLNLRTRLVTVGEHTVELSAREFAMVETFMNSPGQVLSREQLLDRVWGYDYAPGSNIVDVYVGYLRKKLGSNLIETVRGMGYRMPI
ncbi:response regulator transcription factor [Leptolyngbya cf. ectocarpi LEGE 11479]|uniref:Response regulator transcription factor n=1 Tax=Leptolyngbya cf. ectocarpi LEGE 11479 TaxID=1828722 RepID=A0A929FD40_LEPEC|nr:response regulator transcription factor [Leptolyngbya ectocarpi]MBE9070732.1 response regulator transcription factor [Leptolyngbya cf. ectocarpi LEGE 11479]